MNKQIHPAPAADRSGSPALRSAVNPIGATRSLADLRDGGESVSQTGKAGAPNLPTYSYRTEACSQCEAGCDECDRGEVDCACADCARIAPLNDDGLCRYCDDGRELTTVQMQAKWLVPHILRDRNAGVEL